MGLRQQVTGFATRLDTVLRRTGPRLGRALAGRPRSASLGRRHDRAAPREEPMSERYQQIDAAKVPRFADIATFMRAQRAAASAELDIALVGVPFDLGVNHRSGARQGPAAVREASRIIRRVHPTSGIEPFDLCDVADVGDAPVNALDLEAS